MNKHGRIQTELCPHSLDSTPVVQEDVPLLNLKHVVHRFAIFVPNVGWSLARNLACEEWMQRHEVLWALIGAGGLI